MSKSLNEELKSLTRGSLSAHETYSQVIEKMDNPEEINELSRIQSEHREAVEIFRKKCHEMGVEAPESSGAWGMLAKSLTGSSKVFGKETALKALKEGEEHGRSQFENAYKNPELPEDLRETLRQKLIPAQERHLASLESLERAA